MSSNLFLILKKAGSGLDEVVVGDHAERRGGKGWYYPITTLLFLKQSGVGNGDRRLVAYGWSLKATTFWLV